MSGDLHDLETPCLIADRRRIEANAARMRARAEEHDFVLRPHLKTAKSAAIARIAHGGNIGPVTVSTLREADYFRANGYTDMTYAVAITPNKFEHMARLLGEGANLKVLVADAAVSRALAAFAASRRISIKVMIEIDSGEHRTGFLPESDELIDAARVVADAPQLALLGLLTHGGHSYACRSPEAVATVAEQERQALLTAQERLTTTGLTVSVTSSGSTPTAVLGLSYVGISEMRPGVYLAGDLFQAQIGSCELDDIALSVLATVIAHDPARNRLVIDAGGLALSKDRSTQQSPIDFGYGLLVSVDGSRFDDALIVGSVHQEHGEVGSALPLPFDELPVGSMVRVLPNHACMTAASYDRYYVTDGRSTAVVDTWDKVSGC